MTLFKVFGFRFTQGQQQTHLLETFASKAQALQYASKMEDLLQQADPDVRLEVVKVNA